MSQTVTFQEALDAGRIKENNYFLVKYPGGNDKLFRLVKKENGYVMWGPLTEKKVTFEGKKGYDNLFTLADNAVREEYSFPELFEEVHACGLPQKQYEVHSYHELLKLCEASTRMYCGFSDDKGLAYALASRCADYGELFDFGMFRVNYDKVGVNTLYYFNNSPRGASYAVRPEAIPKPTMRLEMENRDGSKEHPWICAECQSKTQEEKTEDHREQDKDISKAELVRFIQEGRKAGKNAQEILEELEKYMLEF